MEMGSRGGSYTEECLISFLIKSMDFRHSSAPHSPRVRSRSPSPDYTPRRIPDLPVKHQLFPMSPPLKAVRAEGDRDFPAAETEIEASFAVIQRVPAMRNTPATHFPSEDEELLSSRRLSSPLPKLILPGLQNNEQVLLKAAESNDPVLCRTLLDNDECLDPNSASPDCGWTPLHLAASRGYSLVCEVFLDYGSRVHIDSRTALRQTPLHLAVMGNYKGVVQLLVRAGASLNVADFEGNTPVHIAAGRGFGEIVQWMLLRGPDLTVRNTAGFTAREVATEEVLAVFQASSRPRTSDPPPAPTVQQVPILSSRKDEVTHMLTKVSPGSLARSFSNPDLEDRRTAKPSTLDFEALQELGRGSFGEVYLVRKLSSSKLFAMKVLRKDKILGQNLLKYALTERNVLSYVAHPFIVKLHYAFQTSDKLFLILDYCPGGDLGWHLQREKRFSEYRARIYMCEIVLAVEELHRRSILFRDLKPDNVLLDGEGHVRLTDFGLSKENVRENQLAKSFCGSIAYLAPEMLMRAGHGKAVDWYLLGVLMYEMLVGEPPYFSTNKEQLFHNIQRGKLKLPAFVSQEARALLIEVSATQLLQRNPAKRLGSGPRDAEEIKEHRFFYSVNWDSVARRELRPPIPLKPKLALGSVLSESILGSVGSGMEYCAVQGWSFVSSNVD